MPLEHLQGSVGGVSNAAHSVCGFITDRVLLVPSEGKDVGPRISSLPNYHLWLLRFQLSGENKTPLRIS